MSSLVQAKCTNSSAGAELGVVLQAFLDEVFDRLDVVVGGALDLLDARGVGDGEVVGQRAAGVRARPASNGASSTMPGFVGQREQPFDLDPHARLDQAVLGEDRAQRVDLAGIAAIERGQGEQRGVGHRGGFGGRERASLNACGAYAPADRLQEPPDGEAQRTRSAGKRGDRIEHDSMGELRVPADAL